MNSYKNLSATKKISKNSQKQNFNALHCLSTIKLQFNGEKIEKVTNLPNLKKTLFSNNSQIEEKIKPEKIFLGSCDTFNFQENFFQIAAIILFWIH